MSQQIGNIRSGSRSSVSCPFLTVIAAIPAIPTRHSQLCPTNDLFAACRPLLQASTAFPRCKAAYCSNALAARVVTTATSTCQGTKHDSRLGNAPLKYLMWRNRDTGGEADRYSTRRLCLEPGRRVQLVISDPWGSRPETDRTSSGILSGRPAPAHGRQ